MTIPMTVYPGAVDSFSNPDPTNPMNSLVVPHAQQHSTLNGVVVLLEQKLGADNSADPNSIDYRVRALEALISQSVYTPLSDHTADSGNSGTTETTLYADIIPPSGSAGSLTYNEDKITAEYGGTFVSSGTATRQVKVKFGLSGSETAILDTGALTLSLSSAWTIHLIIIRKTPSVIRYMASLITEGAALAAYTAVGELTGLDLTTFQSLIITGQAAGTGAASNDIVAKLGTVAHIGRGSLDTGGMTGTGSLVTGPRA